MVCALGTPKQTMIHPQTSSIESKAVTIYAKTIYRELRESGYSGEEVVQLAGELLALLTRDVQGSAVRPAV